MLFNLRSFIWTILYAIIWILLEMCCWFNHHFGLPAHLLSNLWCIFARVFPSQLSTVTGCQGVHPSQPTCVRTSHAPSFTHYSSHTLATGRVILLASVWNHGQGISIRPIAGTSTPNGLRSNWDFLSGRSPYMLASSTLSTTVQPIINFVPHTFLLKAS